LSGASLLGALSGFSFSYYGSFDSMLKPGQEIQLTFFFILGAEYQLSAPVF
jgi:hypothetical protein